MPLQAVAIVQDVDLPISSISLANHSVSLVHGFEIDDPLISPISSFFSGLSGGLSTGIATHISHLLLSMMLLLPGWMLSRNS